MSALTLSTHLLAEIDRRVAALLKRKFKCDPILGQASRMVSRLASLAKIDGSILQHAIEDAIRCRPDVTVLAEPVIPISDSAKRLSAGGNYDICLGTDLRFGDRVVDSVKVDLVVIDNATGVATACEIKRGHGEHDSGKRRKIIDDMVEVRLVLAGYLRHLGHDVRSADVRLILYYGSGRLDPIPTLHRGTMDAHFGVPVTAMVEAAADLMRQRAREIMLTELRGLLGELGDQLSGAAVAAAADDHDGLVRMVPG